MKTASLRLAAALGLTVSAAAQLGPPHLLPGDLAVGPSAGRQAESAVARGSSGYLVAWADQRNVLSGTVSAGGFLFEDDIYVTRLDASGAVLDPAPIPVHQAPLRQRFPAVAWNGVHYLVVWQNQRVTGTTTMEGIYAARVTPAGEVLDDPPIVIDDQDGVDERWPAVASDGDRWVVLWEDVDATLYDTLDAAVVDASGAVLSKKTLTAPGNNTHAPSTFRIAHARSRYLVASIEVPGGPSSAGVNGRLYDADMSEVGSHFLIAQNQGGVSASNVASNGSGFYVTWGSSFTPWVQTRGTPVMTDGTVVIPHGEILSPDIYPLTPTPSAAWDGTSWGVLWQFWGSGGYSVYLSQASPAGQLVGDPTELVPPAYLSVDARAASMPSGLLALWTDGRNADFDIYGMAVSPSGQPGTAYPVSVSPPAQTHPDLDGDTTVGQLAVFSSRSSVRTRIAAQRLDAAGRAVDPEPITLATAADGIGRPRAAWNGSVWLAVWEVNPGSAASRVYGRRVAPDGTLLDPSNFLVMNGDSPDVAAIGDTFIVTASKVSTNDEHVRSLVHRRVRGSDGAVLDGTDRLLGIKHAEAPRVEAFADRWLVAWQRRPTHDSPCGVVRAAFVLPDGSSPGELDYESSATSQRREPAVATNLAEALVTWSDGDDLLGRRVAADGTFLDPAAGFVVSGAPNTQFGPAVGWSGDEWLAAWNDYRAHPILEPGTGDVYATRIDAGGAVLDPGGLAVADQPAVPEAGPAISGAGGESFLAYAGIESEQPFATFRVMLRTTQEGSVTSYCAGDGSGTSCPCGNEGTGAGGCGNSAFPAGCELGTSGLPGIATDDLALVAQRARPGQPGLFFQGTNQVNGGQGVPFGDGLRCAGGSVVRLETRTADANGDVATTIDVAAEGGVAPGDTRTYQLWYRDPAIGPCGSGFNLSNGLSILGVP